MCERFAGGGGLRLHNLLFLFAITLLDLDALEATFLSSSLSLSGGLDTGSADFNDLLIL